MITGADPHFVYVLSYSPLRDYLSGSAQFDSDLGSTVILPGLVVDFFDILLCGLLTLLSCRGLVFSKGTIAGAVNVEMFQHSGDGDAAFGYFRCLHLGSNLCIDGCCQSFPRMPMAFLGHQGRPGHRGVLA